MCVSVYMYKFVCPDVMWAYYNLGILSVYSLKYFDVYTFGKCL